MLGAIKTAATRFTLLAGVLMGIGFLWDCWDDIQSFTAGNPYVTAVAVIVVLIWPHSIWDVDKEKKQRQLMARFKGSD